MRKQIEFKDVKDGEFFECYGDVHLNYNSRKMCKCIRLDKITAREVNGIIFNIREIDTVYKLGSAADDNEVVRIEDFGGLEFLVNDYGFITKERLDDVIKEYIKDQYPLITNLPRNFSMWCNEQN